jgi:hypothetical protein
MVGPVLITALCLVGCTTPPARGDQPPTTHAASPSSTPHLDPPLSTSDLTALSSEFDASTDLAGWTDLRRTEGGPDWVTKLDVDRTVSGSLYLEPGVCGWYASYRGVLLYRMVSGDAILHLRLRAQGVHGDDPVSIYSLGGAMLRVPEPPGAASRSDLASWAFITLGAGDKPRQVETKTTAHGLSDLVLHPSQTGWNEVVLARIGGAVVTAYRPDGGAWRVMSRWHRPDLPDRLQWGIAAYTDWRTFSPRPSAEANAHTWPGRPDLRLSVDWARFARPAPPPAGLDLADPRAVPDAALLAAITGG